MASPLSTEGVPGTATGVATTPAKIASYKHPLDPLTPEEVSLRTGGVRPDELMMLNVAFVTDRRGLARGAHVCRGEDGREGPSVHHVVAPPAPEACGARTSRDPVRHRRSPRAQNYHRAQGRS